MEQGLAALEEFGFAPVAVGEPGAPTPGRIADRLSDIALALDEAIVDDSWESVVEATARLRRLRLALDAWDFDQLGRIVKVEKQS